METALCTANYEFLFVFLSNCLLILTCCPHLWGYRQPDEYVVVNETLPQHVTVSQGQSELPPNVVNRLYP